MNRMMRLSKHILLLLTVPLLILAVSCGDEQIVPPNGADGYFVEGVLFYNYDNESSLCRLKLTKDGKDINDAEVSVEGTVVPHAGLGVYRSSSPGIDLSPGDTHTVTIMSGDGDELFSQDFVLPDTFSAIVADPADHIYVVGGNVLLGWNGSANVLGRHYVVTVVPEDSTGVVVDYAAAATEPTNSWTITPVAFQKSDGTLIEDRYDIYVLAYRETFYDPNDSEIFFPLPAGIFSTGNISTETFSGTIGVGTLSKGDFVDVDKQE